jgi:hypothetical protein
VVGTIEIRPEIVRDGAATIVGYVALTPDGERLGVRFTMEGLPEPSALAATEAMLIAAIALGMQRGCALRMHGSISRSLHDTMDLYQQACASWWPQRYRRIPIEVDIVDDRLPTNTRAIVCFSGGIDSVYSARRLGAGRQIDAGLFVQGYDIDPGCAGEPQQRRRVARLLDRLGLTTIVIATNARQVLGQGVIEGAQGSYLAAALTLLSDHYGRGFVSTSLIDLNVLAVPDPVHEATTPLLGSARYPIHVYGGPVSRIDKLREIATDPALLRDVRVCLDRTNEENCGRCAKCLLNAFACVAVTGAWPDWCPEEAFDADHTVAMPLTEHQRRYGQDILKCAAANRQQGEWRSVLTALLNDRPGTDPFTRQILRGARASWRRLFANNGVRSLMR